MLTVSVIIVSWNTRELTRRAVDSALAQQFDGTLEVLVVDNGSADGTVEALAGLPGVRVIASPRNWGFAGGNNLGLQRARGEYALLLNSDALLEPGAVQILLDEARAHPEAGALSPRLTGPDGLVQYTCWYLPSLANEFALVAWRRRRVLSPEFQAALAAQRDSYEVPAVQLAALLVPLRVWSRIGLMATEPFLYFEEGDLSLRLARAGYTCRYVPAARVLHLEGQSTGQVPHRRRAAHYASRLWFYRTHRDRCSAALIRLLSLARATVGLLRGGAAVELWRAVFRSARGSGTLND